MARYFRVVHPNIEHLVAVGVATGNRYKFGEDFYTSVDDDDAAAILALEPSSDGMVYLEEDTSIAGTDVLPLAEWIYYVDWSEQGLHPAGSLHGTFDPVPGGSTACEVLINDPNGYCSVGEDGLFHCAGAGGTANPRIDLTPSVTRAVGLMFYLRMRVASGINWFGFDNNLTSSAGQAAARIEGATELRIFAGEATEQPRFASSLRANEFIEYMIVVRSTGCLYYLRGTQLYPTWTLIWAEVIRGSTAALFPCVSNFSAVFDIAAMGVAQLLSPFTTDYGSADDSSSSNGGASALGRSDMVLPATWIPSADSQEFIYYARRVDDSNNIKIVYNCGTRGTPASGTVRVYERVGAVDSELGTSQTWTSAAAGLANQCSAILNGNNIRTYAYPAAAAEAMKHNLTEETYRYEFRMKAFWSGGGTATFAQWPIHMSEQASVPLKIDTNRLRQVYVDVDTGTADPDIATSSYRVGVVGTQVNPSMTTLGSAAGRALANTNMAAFGAAGGIYNIMSGPGTTLEGGAGWGLHSMELSLSGDPTTFSFTTHIDREYDWWIARGGKYISMDFWMAPNFMLSLQDGASANHQKSLNGATHRANFATLAKNVLKRYFDAAGAKYNAQILQALSTLWVELHGYGSYDSESANIARYILDYVAWEATIAGDATLNAVLLGGPYNVATAWRESGSQSVGITQYTYPPRKATIETHLKTWFDDAGTAPDFVNFDHWIDIDAGTLVTKAEQLRRTAGFGEIASIYKTLTGLPVHCYEMYPHVSLADVGTDYGSSDYHAWAACWFASAHHHLIKAGADSGYHWAIQGDGTLAYEGNQASNLLQDTRYTGGSSYVAGSAFPTYDVAMQVLNNFVSGTALKRSTSTDPLVLVLASATKTWLINQHAYSVEVMLDKDGVRTLHTLTAYQSVVL